MNQQPLVKTRDKRLNSCIQIDSAKINRRVSIPYQINFCLNAQLLEEIRQIRANNFRLELSARNIVNLRHYALVNLPLDSICDRRQLESIGYSSLTFTTQYSASENQPAVTLFRSEIDLAGKISQQVRKNLYQDSLLLTQISQAHYWLVLEILAQLPLKSTAWYSWPVAACFYIAVAIACAFIWYISPFASIFKVAICLAIVLVSKLVFKTLITKQLKSWVVHHLLKGIFARGFYRQQLGLKLLSFLTACN